VHELSTEVPVGPADGLDHEGAVNCDNIVTVPVDSLGRLAGYLLPEQESGLSRAVQAAFDRD
jgi:mRNA interferase MazF